jgi:beta-lactamase superfamily II metal-dependent hydrolase
MTDTPDITLAHLLRIENAARVTMSCLWCDQGMANMLTANEYEDDYIPDVVALFDFGTTVRFITKTLVPKLAAPAVERVCEVLESQEQAGKPPRIDLVVISHQDEDHWKLLRYLMDAVKLRKIPMTVGKIIYAGSDWGNTARNTLIELGTYTANPKKDLTYWDTLVSDYSNPSKPPTQADALGDIVIRTLIANSPTTSKAKSNERKNATSAVMVIDYAGERIILPGDATYETLNQINIYLSAWKNSPVQPVSLMSAPHHGALATMTKSSTTDNDADLSELIRFTELTQPDSVITSAGIANSHSHPHAIVLKKLIKYAGSGAFLLHPVVYYDLVAKEFRVQKEVMANLYTTVLGLDTPVPVANWFYTLTPDDPMVTNVETFYGACKALINVPDTSPDVFGLEMEISEDDDMNGDMTEAMTVITPLPSAPLRFRSSPEGRNGMTAPVRRASVLIRPTPDRTRDEGAA